MTSLFFSGSMLLHIPSLDYSLYFATVDRAGLVYPVYFTFFLYEIDGKESICVTFFVEEGRRTSLMDGLID